MWYVLGLRAIMERHKVAQFKDYQRVWGDPQYPPSLYFGVRLRQDSCEEQIGWHKQCIPLKIIWNISGRNQKGNGYSRQRKWETDAPRWILNFDVNIWSGPRKQPQALIKKNCREDEKVFLTYGSVLQQIKLRWGNTAAYLGTAVQGASEATCLTTFSMCMDIEVITEGLNWPGYSQHNKAIFLK